MGVVWLVYVLLKLVLRILVLWKFVAFVLAALKLAALIFRLPNGMGGVVIGKLLGEVGGKLGECLAVAGFVFGVPISAGVVGGEGGAVAVFALPCGGDVGGGG